MVNAMTVERKEFISPYSLQSIMKGRQEVRQGEREGEITGNGVSF